MIAKFVAEIHKRVKIQMWENKANQDELDAFDAKIHKEEGKLGYLELGKLNNVKKQMYI